MFTAEPMGQGWLQISELGLAFVLSALIGLEREIRQKSAGLRTYTLVGFASALILIISKYGFTNILEVNRIVVDPSRIAAQIVTGIGFIGGGVIFVRKDIVRGLTTAATVWLTAAVGMACGAGLPILALVVTAGHFVVVCVFPVLERHLPRSRWTPSRLQISYRDGKGILRDVLVVCAQYEFSIARTTIEMSAPRDGQGRDKSSGKGKTSDEPDSDAIPESAEPRDGIVTLTLDVRGSKSVTKLAGRLSEIAGVVAVSTIDETAFSAAD